MKNSILLGFALIMALGCKMADQKKTSDKIRPNQPIGDSRELTGTEKSIVKSACEALQQKRLYFESLFDDSLKFTFDISEKGCNSADYSLPNSFEAFLRGTNSGDLELYSNYRSTYFKDIVTDQTGMVGELCSRYFDGEAFKTIIEVSGAKYRFNITKFKKYDVIESARYLNDNAPSTIELIYVTTPEVTNEQKVVGVVYERSRLVPCALGGNRAIRQRLKSMNEL